MQLLTNNANDNMPPSCFSEFQMERSQLEYDAIPRSKL